MTVYTHIDYAMLRHNRIRWEGILNSANHYGRLRVVTLSTMSQYEYSAKIERSTHALIIYKVKIKTINILNKISVNVTKTLLCLQLTTGFV